MTRATLMIALWFWPLAPLFGQVKAETPGNPPEVLIATQIDAEGNLVLVEYRTIFLQPAIGIGGGPIYNDRSLHPVSLKDVKIYDGPGKELSLEAARKRLGKKETAIVATSHEHTLPVFYRTLFKDDVLLFVFPRESPTWKTIQEPELHVR